jgi:hypothetical protein
MQDLPAIQQLCAYLKQLPSYAFELDKTPDSSSSGSAPSFSAELALPDAPKASEPVASKAQLAITGIALCCQDGSAAYIPLTSTTPAAIWSELASLMADTAATKVTFGFKQQLLALKQLRKQLPAGCAWPQPADPVVDVRIAAWLLCPDSSSVAEQEVAGRTGRLSPTKVLEQMLERWFKGNSVALTLQGLAGPGRARQRYLDQCKHVVLARKAFGMFKVGWWRPVQPQLASLHCHAQLPARWCTL